MAEKKVKTTCLDKIIDEVAAHECMNVFLSAIKRSVILDFIIGEKLLTSEQTKKILAKKNEIQEVAGNCLPEAIGLLLESLNNLTAEERKMFTEEHLACASDFMDDYEKRTKGVKRSKKLGPLGWKLWE